jgi:DNA replication and repair protein RecF
MILTSLTLQNFRSYTKKTFEFDPGATIIVGPNAIGKTNILEAIILLSSGKCFRADMDREGIRWGMEMTRVSSKATHEDQIRLEVVLTQGQVAGQKAPLKKFLVNGIPRGMIDFVGNLRAVLFWPEDLELVTDSPSIRRKYLDSVLVQIDREYRRNLLSYERGLRQRNKLLDMINEGKASRSQLLFWNQLLIKNGEYITGARDQFLAFVNGTTLSDHVYKVSYDKSIISQSRLDQYKDEEIAAKATLVGPHRDDFEIKKYQLSSIKYHETEHVTHDAQYIDLSKYGSRGEQRLAVLWLKLAQLDYIENVTHTRPILLLDDIFSELDHVHQQVILEIIKKQQTIITSANTDIIDELGLSTWHVVRL